MSVFQTNIDLNVIESEKWKEKIGISIVLQIVKFIKLSEKCVRIQTFEDIFISQGGLLFVR